MATSGRLCTMASVLVGMVLIAACAGPAGPQGPPGEQGPTGESGPAGEDGRSLVGVMCDPGEAVIGFDESGDMVCGRLDAEEVLEASQIHDTTPPELAAFDLQPDAVSLANGPGEIVFTARVVDEGSGNVVDEVSHEDIDLENMTSDDAPVSHALFRSPNGNHFFFVLLAGRELVDGTPNDGLYEYTATLREGLRNNPGALGEWELHYVMLVDQAGNSQRLMQDEIEALDMPTNFIVE